MAEIKKRKEEIVCVRKEQRAKERKEVSVGDKEKRKVYRVSVGNKNNEKE